MSFVRSAPVRGALACLLVCAAALLATLASGGAGAREAGSTARLGPELQERLRDAGGEPLRAILTFEERPAAEQLRAVRRSGVAMHNFEVLPMVAVEGSAEQIRDLLSLRGLRSVWADRRLEYLLHESVPLIGADRVWRRLGYRGAGVGVAILDSGIDGTHPDVEYPRRTVQNVKITGVPDGGSGLVTYIENLPNTDTTSGHGTHVAGIVGADGSASRGYYRGVAPRADLVGIGAGDALFILYALEGFDYALANQKRYDIRVISNSWGTSGEFDPDDPVNVASRLAHDRGITVVFAAGNEGPEEDTLNPYAVAPWVIGVAAGEKDGRTLAGFSSRGRPGSRLYAPDITAPGVAIVSTRASTGATINALDAPEDALTVPPQYLPYYTTASGTSMAAPHVSGVVALMEQANPALGPDRIKRILEETASEMPYPRWMAGAGYLDAYAAVRRAESLRR
ncbi:peptidase S8 and S53, subtilisin, kexin, sedolisin [Rubrobacter xylanophilus DSM 9941]|uniref:Peptidase S8 and S53, subtilisin, kexin, sedolisin n=1 Tax=Rubrobacter xylanophilus (strain DSM 9941 / JCM 11954 / NBRC 16129 / PRD-1) TaxID=266117 RepID=Q1ARY8_RUBXD|nr:S8 family serine peptidase [Rubrobacter xylanophilus]ABG05840.1 peptidase S8 and S53, subtilisin, kexin, sedolisin [Rubrobacter xylanophilus DSM 9941]